MAVGADDVRHIASLARLALPEDRVASLVVELNSILRHMDVLSRVDTAGLAEVAGVGASGTPLRTDEGPPVALLRTPAEFAPLMRDGFFLVPRLDTHDDASEA